MRVNEKENARLMYDTNAYARTFNNGRESSVFSEEQALELSDKTILEELNRLKS